MSTTVEGTRVWCYFGETCGYHSRLEGSGVVRGRPVSTANRQFIESNTIVILQFRTKVHCACQEQCYVCLGSHLTNPCLPCVVTSKTAAIHVRWQDSMCKFWVARYSSCSLEPGRPSF